MPIQVNWNANPAEEKVVSYNIYHGPAADTTSYLYNTTQNVAIVYPDQLGYLPGDTVFVSVSATNATGEGPESTSVQVTLPVPLPLPSAPTGLTAVLF